MATTNYSWNLPTVGGSEDDWGTQLNANWTAVDTLLGGVSDTEFAILDGATITTVELNELGDFAGAFTLPATDGTDGQVMTTNGAGVLTFEDAGGGVTGPVSSSDNHVAFFDGTTGQVIKQAGSQEMFMNTVCLFKTDLAGVQILSGVGPSLSPTGFWGSKSVFIGDKDTGPGYHVDEQTSVNGRQVGIGSHSLKESVGSTSLCGNTAIGAFSGTQVTTGNKNTYLGYSSGETGTTLFQTGSNNTFVGANTGNDSVFRLDQNLAANNRIIMGNASISNAYINVQWSVTSDVRDKTDFAPLTQGLDVVDAIETYTFKFDPRSKYYVYDDDRNIIETPEPDGTNKSDQTFVGFKAQQVEEVLNAAGFPPDVIVDTENPDHYKMKETAMIPLLINAIKELKARVETLESGV